ncbi:MAG: hypothetical protein RL572_56 [Pseudomonadota bacterium]|jgi:thioredoxin 2
MSDQIYVTCPHCHRKNRMPAPRLSEKGTCGACKQALFNGHPVPLSRSSFDQHLSGDVPLLVDFWAPWCGPCRSFAPTFDAAAASFEPRLRLVKVNTEVEQALAQRFAIRSIPTLVLFHKGHEVARLSGALPPARLQQWVQQHLPN